MPRTLDAPFSLDEYETITLIQKKGYQSTILSALGYENILIKVSAFLNDVGSTRVDSILIMKEGCEFIASIIYYE